MFLGMFRTAFFLVSICCCSFYWCHGCLEEERTLLLQIKDSINYPAGSFLDGGWVGKNCCQWYGVDCNPSSFRVISIDLSSVREERLGLWYPNTSLFATFKELKGLYLDENHIGGWVMPQAFSDMQNLRELDLFTNNLSAGIDSLRGLYKLKNLRVLDLGENNLDGRALPPYLSNLSKLEELYLGGNDLGSYPIALTGICELTTLRGLYLGRSRLNDQSIPKCLGNLSLLEELRLEDNELQSPFGSLTAFSGMQSLRKLYLSSNDLSAGIDSLRGLCELKNLRILHLDENNLDGRAFHPCLSNLSKLEEFSLVQNHLGSYPSAQSAFSGMHSLRKLYLSSNNLSAGIDSLRGLCELKNLRILHLDENNLDGRAFHPCLSNLSRLEELALHRNQLGSYPSAQSDFSGMQSLRKLYLSSNNLSAGIDSLRGLCELKNLRILHLDENNLDGRAFHPCLSNLSRLEEFSLVQNHLGSYPSAQSGICELTALRVLYLGRNRLNDHRIPKCLGNLSLLEVLDLSDNELKSPFSSLMGFCELRNLQTLDVDNNSYVGSIPQCFGNMNSLKTLFLSYNRFTGTIPSSIFQNLTNLVVISTSHNQLNDSISFSMFANLSKLIHIDLSDNAQLEVETEHPHWVPTFQLQSLFLNNCILNKRGGSGIPTFISTQQSLKTLDLSHNFLNGTIPSWLLDNLTVGSLILGGNLLKGPFPQSTQRNNSMLNELDISDNKIFGELPSNIDTLFPNLIIFNMSKNELHGTIPVSMSKLQKLGMLDLSQNNLFGEMPHGLIIRNNTSLKYLRLSNNKLQGNILSKFSNMTELVVLLLDNNGFTGTIASNMLSSPSLKILDLSKNNLSGFIPSWLPLLMNLAILHLDGNFFNGHIPSEVCQMQNLHILDLSNNTISGSIPSCLPNISSWMKEISIDIDISFDQVDFRVIYSLNTTFTSSFHTRVTTILTTKGMTLTYEGLPLSLMTVIDLSMNQLTGHIPFQMGHLKALHSLNLSNNILSGPIPKSFQNLESIESLDLSHNKIIGTIPPQMVQLFKLSVFNVSFNNLSGAIPYEKQFLTFNESSYTANPSLCGPPLQRSCSCNNSSQPRDNKGEEEEEDDSTILDSLLFFYLWVAISYILGFWGFLALFANKNWRWKFFSTVDRCFDSSYLNLHMFRLYLKNCCCN